MFIKTALAAAAFVAAGAAFAGTPVQPGGSLGVLGVNPALFGAGSNAAAAAPFSFDYTFTLTADSDVIGSVGWLDELLGFNLLEGTFATVEAGGQVSSLVETPTGYGFSFANLAAGDYTLTITGSLPQGLSGYIGGVYAIETTPPVPEPEALGLMLAGLGVAGAYAARRKKAA